MMTEWDVGFAWSGAVGRMRYPYNEISVHMGDCIDVVLGGHMYRWEGNCVSLGRLRGRGSSAPLYGVRRHRERYDCNEHGNKTKYGVMDESERRIKGPPSLDSELFGNENLDIMLCSSIQIYQRIYQERRAMQIRIGKSRARPKGAR